MCWLLLMKRATFQRYASAEVSYLRFCPAAEAFLFKRITWLALGYRRYDAREVEPAPQRTQELYRLQE